MSYSFASRKIYKYDYPSCHTKSHLSIMKEISKFSNIMVLMNKNYFLYMLNLCVQNSCMCEIDIFRSD